MPKIKTHKSFKKRVKITKNGKVLRGKPGRRHLLSGKPSKRKRKLRRSAEVGKEEAFRVKRLLGLV
jgi:large subunit ribosomal protein L35